MNQNSLPLYEALCTHQRKNTLSFHVPGHKGGLVFPQQALPLYRLLLSIDVTELTGLDDLHHPTGVIHEAEKLAAHLYGSKDCFFLVGGSTVGNIAMIMAACKEGDSVLVQRNSHKSILNALKLARVNPIFLQPEFDESAQIATCISEGLAIEKLKKYPNAKAIIITSPNYYGHTLNLAKIVKTAHAQGTAVLVDEAHGAHFGHQSKLFPRSAIHYGADIVVQSAHKTLPAMTMASFLHYSSTLIQLKKLRYYLQLFQSSSPSYPLMASLDLARFFLATVSESDVKRTLAEISLFKNRLNEIPQLQVIANGKYELDPLKIIVQSRCRLSGFELQKLFEEEGIYPELADRHNVLLIMPLVITINLAEIEKKIKRMLRGFEVINKLPTYYSQFVNQSDRLALTYEQMEALTISQVPLEQAVGEIVAEEIIPYPPGVPLLLSGEKLTTGHLQQLVALKQTGAYFQGADVFCNGIKIFKSDEGRSKE